jgi:excisionase family DNA binding protein
MADVLLSIEEVSKQLQLSKDQIADMVKKGLLRGFLDQKTYKFRSADVEAFKKKVASSATTVSGGAPKTDAIPGGTQGRKDAAGKMDLSEVESDSDVEDTDQTSVLAPVESGAPQDKPPEKPVFKFGEKDLESREEALATLEEGDQTSLLVPGAGKEEKPKAETKPTFDFAKKDLKPPADADAGDSVLVADESESSMDILEVAEESSSESASSASHITFPEEGSSGEEIEAATETPSKLEQRPAPKPAPRAGEPTTDKVVTDILGPAQEESDEALETLDVDEVVETKEAVGKEAGFKPATAPTAPVGDEYETVGLPSAEETKAATDAAGAAGETGGIDEAVAAALQEQAAEEESEEAEGQEQVPLAARTGWESAESWPIGNGLLIAATVVLIVGGALLFCEAFNVHNGLTAKIASVVQAHLH